MKNSYLNLQTKRALKHYPAIFAITLLLIVCISLACVLMISKSNNDDSKQKIKIAITGDLTQTYLDIGITALQSLDSSRFSIEIETLDEESAKKALQNGEISGYLKVPEDFVDAVMDMDNIPLVYVTSDSPSSFGSILLNEVAKTISNTVSETQRGIYGMQKASRELGKKSTLKKNTKDLNIIYIESVLKRTDIYENEYLGAGDGISTGAYFICGGIVIFMLLWGISCNSYLFKRDRSIEKLLISKGISITRQTLAEYLSYLAITLVTFMTIFLLGGYALQYFRTGIRELEVLYTFDYFTLFIKLIPVIIMFTALQFMLYESVSSYVGIILVQFVFALGSGYICGCLYPSYYFPEAVQKFASFLPTGVGVSYARTTLSGNTDIKTLFATIGFSVCFLFLSIAIRKHRNAGKE